MIINSRVPLANSENWRWWLYWISVRGLVYLVGMNVTLAHSSLPILFDQLLINSRVQFQANSENWRRWLICISVRGLVCLLVRMNVTRAHISLPFYLNRWKSTHGFHSDRTRRTSVVECTVVRYVDWLLLSSYECHACSHFLAILFRQTIINSRVPFRANSNNWRRWLFWISVRGLVYLVPKNVTLAHISLPFCSVRQ
jgi:hypothetical protein